MQVENNIPTVLCFSGLDPSGGAGIQADIESIAANGGHALPIITCLTAQNSSQTTLLEAIDAKHLLKQTELLVKDIEINACKIGVIPNKRIASMLTNILELIPNIPVVFDPVFVSSSGTSLCDLDTIVQIKQTLLQKVTLLTPNHRELLALSKSDLPIETQAKEICELGTEYVLLTGADETTPDIVNTLFTQQGELQKYIWSRLPHHYHGSGCTLSSATACQLARGKSIKYATKRAQEYTWSTLKSAKNLGRHQKFPNRISL